MESIIKDSGRKKLFIYQQKVPVKNIYFLKDYFCYQKFGYDNLIINFLFQQIIKKLYKIIIIDQQRYFFKHQYQTISKQINKLTQETITCVPNNQNNKIMSLLCNAILKAICPCFYSQKKDFSHYEYNQMIERQQFISPDSIDNDYDIKHKYEQKNKYQNSLQQTTTQSSRQRVMLQLENDQLDKRLQQQSIMDGQFNSMNQTPIEKQIIYHDYTDVIAADHAYYDILYPKLQILSTLFDIDEKYQLQVSPTTFPMKMFCKQSQVRKTNIFIYFYEFTDTNYQSYEQLLNNFQVQKSFDPNINEYYKKMQSPNKDTKVIYLSYNKVLIIAPRDFIYVRYVFKKGNQYWSISTSIPNEEQTDKVRGQIVLTATKVIQKQNKIHVSVYSEVNMMMGIKPEMAKNRGKSEIVKYLEKCYKYLTQNRSQSIL